jgi:hypothetical protein
VSLWLASGEGEPPAIGGSGDSDSEIGASAANAANAANAAKGGRGRNLSTRFR